MGGGRQVGPCPDAGPGPQRMHLLPHRRDGSVVAVTVLFATHASYLEHLQATEAHEGVLCVKMLWLQVDACLRYDDFLPALAGGRIILLHRRDVSRAAEYAATPHTR